MKNQDPIEDFPQIPGPIPPPCDSNTTPVPTPPASRVEKESNTIKYMLIAAVVALVIAFIKFG